jgi:hypothetical protein
VLKDCGVLPGAITITGTSLENTLLKNKRSIVVKKNNFIIFSTWPSFLKF